MIYLDSSFVIAVIETFDSVGEKARDALAKHADERFVISSLVIMETLVMPISNDDYQLRMRYERFFEQLEILEAEEPVMLRAAELRAKYTLATGDAIHLACAEFNLCTGFWTNDKRLNKIASGLAVKVLSEL